MKYKKHYYTFQDGTYYEFPNSKEIIIDADVILKSKNKIYRNLLINSRKSVKRDLVSDRGIEKTSIIVILGHFNHGKTTLLDALGNFTIVEKEVHGITQVIIFTVIETVPSTHTQLSRYCDQLSLTLRCRTFSNPAVNVNYYFKVIQLEKMIIMSSLQTICAIICIYLFERLIL